MAPTHHIPTYINTSMSKKPNYAGSQKPTPDIQEGISCYLVYHRCFMPLFILSYIISWFLPLFFTFACPNLLLCCVMIILTDTDQILLRLCDRLLSHDEALDKMAGKVCYLILYYSIQYVYQQPCLLDIMFSD